MAQQFFTSIAVYKFSIYEYISIGLSLFIFFLPFLDRILFYSPNNAINIQLILSSFDFR
jgi:hypothetical protein